MNQHVADYNCYRIAEVVGNRFNGIATANFYSKFDKCPANSELFTEVVDKIEYTREMVSSYDYSNDFVLYGQSEDCKVTRSEATIEGTSITRTPVYNRKTTIFRKCLGGVLVIHLDSDSLFKNKVGYVSTLVNSNKLFMELLFKIYCTCKIPQVQMDTAQGEVTQDSHQASNTIITRDKDQSKTEEQHITTSRLREICSTEDELQFESIVNRWMALDTIKVNINNTFNQMLKVYNIPKFLYTESFAPNLMPFQNFIYGNYNIEFRFVVNANKFHVGKVVCAIKYDSYQIDGIRNDVVSLLARPHIILDLSANNEGVLSVPFKYHRTYVRNASASASSFGVKDAQYATVNIAILSPLKIAPGAPTVIDIRPFYRLKQAYFTGMSYGVPVVQMEAALGALALEEGLKFIGNIVNKDKPIDLQRQAQYVPKPRLNFSTGKGASDVNPIKLDPSTLTTFTEDHEYPEDPSDVVEIARIWGFVGSFEWNTSSTEGSLLYSQPMDPTWRITSSFDGVPTPLEYVSSMYQFWSGPMEVRFDFVSNAFHTGSVIISAEFGRECSSILQASSTYTKVFHLGEQRTVSFVIPYIYDTVWRRTQSVPFCPIQTGLAGGNYGLNAINRTLSSKLTVRVVNVLVPVTSVTPTISVLVFIRAGSEFILHSPIMANLFNSEATFVLDNFPGTYGTSVYKSALIQLLPSRLEKMTGKELRTFWRTGINNENWGRNSWDIQNEKNLNEQPKNERVSELLNYEGLPIPEALVADKPIWLTESLVSYRIRRKDYKTSYDYSKYKFQNWNNGHLIFSVGDKTSLASDITSESIYDTQNHTWVSFEEFAQRNSWFKKQAMIKFLLEFTVLEVQMDQGNDSNTDPTITFSQGKQRKGIQTIESHTNIKDLLRRPVQIVTNQSVLAFKGNNYYFIPCMPPSHMMVLLTGNMGNRIYSPNLGRSYHVHINDMFRFWRGCQRWTFVVDATQAVYISYIPHSGARVVGQIDYGNIVGTTAPLGGFGLGTEILIPSVNPTHVVETPFDMEVNWCLMQEEQASRNYSWRDKGETNSGHLLLQSKAEFTYDLWWAAGDDFKVSNFIGIPPCVNGIQQYYLSDNYPTVQMESAMSVVESVLNPENLLNYLPHIGGGVAVGATCYKVNSVVNEANATMKSAITNMESISTELSKQIGGLLEMLSAKFSWATNLVRWMTDTMYDLILCIVNWNVTTLVITFLRIMGHLFSITLSTIMKYSKVLLDVFSDGIAVQANKPTELISGPYWSESKIGKLIGVIIGIIGISTGSSYGKPPIGFVRKCMNLFSDFKTFAYMNHVIRFVSSIFDLVYDCVKWCCAKTNIQVSAIQQLQDREGLLHDFIVESQTLLEETNSNMFGNPAFKLRFWRNTIRAKQIQREIIKLPSNQVSVVLTKMCNDFIKRSNEKMCDLRSSPIKYEPFIICITGDTKVGKSTMIRYMMPKLLKAMGINSYPSDPIYTRMQSSKFWNGYVDQPVVLIDEWLNIAEPSMLAEAINELYMLKSCATFIPEQAAIEEKKSRASPKIVILLCNNAFPETLITGVAPNKDAVLRRRDVVVRVARKEQYKNFNLRELSEIDSKKCVHVEAQFYNNSSDGDSLDSKLFNFEELSDELATRAVKYDAEEIQRVKLQFEILKEQCGSNIGSLDEDPFAIFYNNIQVAHNEVKQDILPSDQLEAYINQLATHLKYNYDIPEELVKDEEITTQGIGETLIHTKEACIEWIKQKFIKYIGGETSVGACAYCGKMTAPYSVCEGRIDRMTSLRVDQHFLCAVCHSMLKFPTWESFIERKLQKKYSECPMCPMNTHLIVPKIASTLILGIHKFRDRTDFASLLKEYYWRMHAKMDNPITYFLIVNIITILVGGAVSLMVVAADSGPRRFILLNPKGVQVQFGTLELDPNKKTYSKTMSILHMGEGKALGNMALYGFNEKGFAKLDKELYPKQKFAQVKSMDLHADCVHSEIFDNMLMVRYEDSAFIAVVDDSYVPVPLVACNENCPWRSLEFRTDFCVSFFHTHIKDMRPMITSLAADKSLKDTVKACYPAFMLPPWLDIPDELIKIDEKWYEKISIHPVFKKVFQALSALVLAFGFFKGMSWVWSKLTSCISSQAPIPSGDAVIRHFKPKLKHVGRSNISTQSISVEDSVVDKIINNYVTIYAYSEPGKLNRTLTGVGIKQRIAIIPRHYYNWLNQNRQLTLKLGRTVIMEHQIEYKFDPNDFIASETSDIAIFFMPASTNMFKNIQKYMFKDEDYNKKRASQGLMVKVPKRDTHIFTKLELDLHGYRPECSVAEGGVVRKFTHLIEYNYSEAGACGSLVMCHDHQRPIMAMHVAGCGDGFSGTGYGVLLSQEMLDEIPDDPVTIQADDVEEPEWLEDLEKAKIHLPLESNVSVLGCLPPDKIPFTPYQTKITPSLISNKLPWPSVKEPAILSKKDPRYMHTISPLIAGCAKHGYLTKDFISGQLEEVKQVRQNKLMALSPLVIEPEKLSYEDAVGGFDHVSYYDTIKIDTSVGWPWCCSTKTLKNQYCQIEKNDDGKTLSVKIDNCIRREIHRKEALRKEGTVPVTIFIDTLKDEKKDKEKIGKLGGTRVFCASPFDYTISMRQHFLHFIAAYMEHRYKFDHAVGMNVNGSEVTRMVRALLDKGPYIVTIDYSNFGPGFNAGVAANVKSNIVKWTLDNVKGCDLTEMSCLFEEGINSVHAMNNFVYRQRGGSPSGSPITVVINSEVNVQYIYLAWLNLCKSTDNLWTEFENNVALFVYGDDLIMSVSKKYIGVFNGVTIQAFFKEYDIVSTDASKSVKVKPHETIYEATFLKKNFDHHPVHKLEWIAKTQLASIYDTPHWIQESVEKREATRVNAEACLREAYGHGKLFFESLCWKVNKALRDRKIAPILLTWEELDRQHYPDYY